MKQLPDPIARVRMQREAARILVKHGIQPPEDLILTDRSIYEPSWSRSLSNQILDAVFPRTGVTEALHFTRRDVLPGLIEHSALWLTTVSKNLKEGDGTEGITTFTVATGEPNHIIRPLQTNCITHRRFGDSAIPQPEGKRQI